MRPDRARRFAESLGPLVKADYEDAKVLARYGRLEGLEASAPLHLALAQLQDLALVRQRFASLPPGGARRSAAEALRQPPDNVLSPLESGGAARRPTRVDSGC